METKAPQGAVWVCPACGKTSDDKFGEGKNVMHGWDVSCSMHAILCKDDDTLKRGEDGRVTHAEPWKEVEA
jgi:hypothetical protein